MKEEGERQVLVMWDCGSPLYDSFELASVSHLIDRHTMVLPVSSSSSSTTASFQSSSSSVSSSASWSRPSVASTVSKASQSDSGCKGWRESSPKKRKLQEWETVTITPPKAKKPKTGGCFCFGFFKR